MITLNIRKILREFVEILGKYRILDERFTGSIGLNVSIASSVQPSLQRMRPPQYRGVGDGGVGGPPPMLHVKKTEILLFLFTFV